jgi:hypothetical protein
MSALDAIKNGGVNAIPVLAGSTFDMTTIASLFRRHIILLHSIPHIGPDALEELLVLYPNSSTHLRQQYTAATRDFNVFCSKLFPSTPT